VIFQTLNNPQLFGKQQQTGVMGGLDPAIVNPVRPQTMTPEVSPMPPGMGGSTMSGFAGLPRWGGYGWGDALGGRGPGQPHRQGQFSDFGGQRSRADFAGQIDGLGNRAAQMGQRDSWFQNRGFNR